MRSCQLRHQNHLIHSEASRHIYRYGRGAVSAVNLTGYLQYIHTCTIAKPVSCSSLFFSSIDRELLVHPGDGGSRGQPAPFGNAGSGCSPAGCGRGPPGDRAALLLWWVAIAFQLASFLITPCTGCSSHQAPHVCASPPRRHGRVAHVWGLRGPAPLDGNNDQPPLGRVVRQRATGPRLAAAVQYSGRVEAPTGRTHPPCPGALQVSEQPHG